VFLFSAKLKAIFSVLLISELCDPSMTAVNATKLKNFLLNSEEQHFLEQQCIHH
jgi:hypothetical protein